MLHTILQIVADTPAVAEETLVASEEKMSVISLMFKGGWIMIPILILGILAVYILIERYLTIKKAEQVDNQFMNKIRDLVVNGNIDGARAICKDHDTPIARMIDKGVARIGKPYKDIKVTIENVGNLEIFKMEKNLATLATISGAAPMLGFLGTVAGMIRAFYNLSEAGSNVDPGLLAGGIYEALVTTAFGLGVGIMAYIGYNYLTTMVEKVIFKMEATSVDFMDLLHEPA
jgi:biopolymer transport protein ExbB